MQHADKCDLMHFMQITHKEKQICSEGTIMNIAYLLRICTESAFKKS